MFACEKNLVCIKKNTGLHKKKHWIEMNILCSNVPNEHFICRTSFLVVAQNLKFVAQSRTTSLDQKKP